MGCGEGEGDVKGVTGGGNGRGVALSLTRPA